LSERRQQTQQLLDSTSHAACNHLGYTLTTVSCAHCPPPCTAIWWLQDLADAFLAKKKQGLVQGHGSGYGGSGFKFDKAEDAKVKAARKSKAKVGCCCLWPVTFMGYCRVLMAVCCQGG